MQQDGKDDFLGKKIINITADEDVKVFETPLALKLGNLNNSISFNKRKLEVLTTLIPAVGRATKWSQPFETTLVY